MKKNAAIVCFAGVILILCGLIQPVCADPTVYGPTGLIMMPTAESLRYKEFNVGFDYCLGGDSEEEMLYYKVNLGTFESWEFGFVGGERPEEGVYMNAKYYLVSDYSRFPVSVAIGIENLTSKMMTGVYMVASKIFEGGLRGHFGFKATFSDEELDPSIMAGIEYYFTNELSILADVLGQEKVYFLNAGVRYMFWDSFTARVSVLDITNSRDSLYYSLGLTFTGFM
ncbi:hypothetical protein ACFL96_04485 [Thermoproteota archaeon]